MLNLRHDIRFGVRVLSKNPGFTAVAVLILALGIGATTTVFSITNAMLFQPLNRGVTRGLVQLCSRDRGAERDYRRFSYPAFQDLRRHSELFSDLAAYRYDFVGVTEGGTTRRLFAGFVSSSFFPMLGVSIARGRAFTPADDQLGSPPVAIVSHEFWTTSGADPGLVGRTLVVSGRLSTVVGITPPGFTGAIALMSTPLWLPLGQTGGGISARAPGDLLSDRSNRSYGVVGRLAEGLTQAAAAPGLDVLSREFERAHPAEDRNQVIEVGSMPRIGDSASRKEHDPLATVMAFALAMATALLAVVVLNLASMLLARGGLRQREIAIRLAVGASRWSVVRQLLVEASILSLLGGLLGLCVAYGTSRLAVSTLLPLLPMFNIVFDPAPDIRVLVVTLGFAALSTVAFGLGPALRLSRADVVTAINERTGMPSATTDFGRMFTRHGLVVIQIALSLALLTAGGLFFFGAIRSATANLGFNLEQGLIATFDGSLAGYDGSHARAVHLRVLDRLRALNGVASASLASTVPYGESSYSNMVQPAGASPQEHGVMADYLEIGSDYFRTLSVPVLRGREFIEAEERATSPAQVAIVDVEFARRLWPGQSPLGRRIQWDLVQPGGPPPRTYEVVGVVGNIKARLFDIVPKPHVYVPCGGRCGTVVTAHIRMRASGAEAETAMLAAIDAEIRSTDAMLPVLALKTLRQHRDTGFEVWFVRLAAKVFAAFGLAALTIAMVGVFGVRALTVGLRTREFGIRMSLGATAGDVMRLVMSEGVPLVGIGLGVGLVLSVAISRVLAGWIHGVRVFEPAVFVASSLLLVGAMMIACYLPARRATAVEPMTALRNQ